MRKFNQNLKTIFSVLVMLGSIISYTPIVSAQVNSASNSSDSSTIAPTTSNSENKIPQGFANNGWSKNNLKTDQPKNSNLGDSVKLQNVKLQSGGINYVCAANYFTSQNSDYGSYNLAADGIGNTYSDNYDYTTSTYKFYRINSSGVSTTINQPNDHLFGNIVANSTGDAYQIAYDFNTSTTKIYKVANGSSSYSLLYTLTSEKYTSPYGLKLDSTGNIYVSYTNVNPVTYEITSTKLEKLNSAGTLISTFTLPSIPTNTIYEIGTFEISSANLIYFPTASTSSSTAFTSYSLIVLNTDGTQKGSFVYSPNTIASSYELLGVTAIPNGVTGGGVYISYRNQANNQLLIKRIQDTDTFPVSSAVTITANGFLGGTSSILVDSTNAYIYIFQNLELKRIKVSDSSVQYVSPTATYGYNLQMVRNSANEIVFSQSSSPDLYKLDCSTTYTPTTIAAGNVATTNNSCYLNYSTLTEIKSYGCFFTLIKGLTFTMPTEFRVKFEGSSNSTTACSLSESSVYCSNIPYSDLNTSVTKNIQISINSGTYFNAAAATTWQPFSGWASNPITLKGQTEEILYNNKMYQVAWGTDNGLYLRSMDTSNVFSGWQRLSSITAKGTPTLSVDPNGDLYVFSQGTDNGLYFWKVGESGGERWRRLGGITIKDGVTFHTFNGKYWLYATGTDNGLYVAKYSTFSPTSYANPTWMKAGDITVTTKVFGGVIGSNLYQIALGTDNGVYSRTTNPSETWSSWSRYSTMTYGSISTPYILNSKMIISMQPLNNLSLENVFDFTSQTGETIFSSPRVSADNVSVFNNLVTFVGRRNDNKLYYREVNNPLYKTYTSDIQGNNITILNTPSQMTFNNKQYQFVRGTDNQLWVRSRS